MTIDCIYEQTIYLKGALEFCVLAVIEAGEKYGDEIVKLLTKKVYYPGRYHLPFVR